MKSLRLICCCLAVWGTVSAMPAQAEDWPQWKLDSRHSGNAPDRSLAPSLGLVGAVPLTDGIYGSPVIVGGKIYLVDGAGVAFCIDAATLTVDWQTPTDGGPANCNNVSSPAVAGDHLHFGVMAGFYYVLDRKTGQVVQRIDTQDPIFSTPVVGADRVYFATLGAQVYAVDFAGKLAWSWDFVKEVIGFEGNRWSGEQWHAFKKGRVTWKDHFCCSRNLALHEKTLVIPAGGRVVFLDDAGDHPTLRVVGEIPNQNGSEYPAAFGLSLGDDGAAYVQWHRRDNVGRVEILRLQGDQAVATAVADTLTAIDLPGLMSFASVSIRGDDIYRVRPEQGLGLCRHGLEENSIQPIAAAASICSPILLARHAVYGGLDGKLVVAPLSGDEEPWTFATAFGKPITAPAAVCDGRIYFGCEDGYLYVLGPDGKAPLPTRALDLEQIRSPLTGKFTDAKYNWYTNYGNVGCTNANDQGIEPPVRMRWVRRVEGSVKHIPVCGGGRMYTHTAEGQIIAVEQETGRLLWRRYFPGVYLSFTSPLYHQDRLLVPQAGLKGSFLRCLDAATGELLWEQPFSGSPSWSRQFPPVMHGNLAIYASGSGEYAAAGTEKAFAWRRLQERTDGNEVMSFLYSHNNPFYPADNRPLIWAWNIETGELVWQKDYSKYGSGGNDCGLAMMDGQLYYSTFFGYQADQRRRRGETGGVNGLTVSLDPLTGEEKWLSTDYYVTAGCTVTAKDGRLYLGGYNQANDKTKERFIWCLDARDGALVWKSDPVASAVNVVTVGERFIFSNAIRAQCHLFDKKTGEIVYRFGLDYNCTRFTLSEPYLMGPNMDMLDLTDGHKLVATGPAVDSRECLGSAVSNGRIFYISQASGLELSAVTGEDARRLPPVWEKR
ncbi:outer membrane protein assembly factor BamB family protein [Lignipirellula cremea]|uniref:Outer membrane biogenesis protein BamB n=1 Tax=Lignipirellula cremea TaxID=2528010 RepID=A0A518E1V6_9BACT|nr:PQQ-binding-like beta-propeller repeat protein [Lignipirellula cremea]QDU98053.1 outer membrane biogenesis protein BamB [Lignipirellula cremea]